MYVTDITSLLSVWNHHSFTVDFSGPLINNSISSHTYVLCSLCGAWFIHKPHSSNTQVLCDSPSLSWGQLIYSETSLIRHSMGPENNVGLGGCWIMECLLPYLSMVTVPHILVGLERMLDYSGVRLARFHCTCVHCFIQHLCNPILLQVTTKLVG